MIIKTCRECPFLQAHPLSEMLQLLVPRKSGLCGYNSVTKTFAGVLELGLPPGPKREEVMKKYTGRMDVPDIDTIPVGCPLHKGDVIVSLGS